MKKRISMLALPLLVVFTPQADARNQTKQDHAKRPNFLVIVADDLGFSDIGAFGSEIDTPNLDEIARRSFMLTGFHTAPTCSPTRSMLLTGLDHHEAGVGSMAETLTPNQVGQPGYEGYLRSDTASLAELLGAAGYRTHFSGKWHLGLAPEQDPHARGFQTTFALLQGGHNHFGLGLSAERGKFGTTYTRNGQLVPELPKDFYSSDYLAGAMVEQLKAGRAGAGRNKPFFAYLAFTAPHWPLQAPAETIAKYRGRYDAGYDALRAKRLSRQVELGLLDPKVAPHEMELAPLWDSLSPEEKAKEARRMEVYAAMVDRMDQALGRVIKTLKDAGEYDNTIILFLSDNGAEGLDLTHAPFTKMLYDKADNRLENVGAATSYEALGVGWASAASAPSWRFKGYTTEGGTRTPAFIAGPRLPQGLRADYTNVADVVPTFLELARIKQPGTHFAGREVQPIRGKSWVSWLQGKSAPVYGADAAIGEELFGHRGLRQGDWKIVDVGDNMWRLFNVAVDPGETRDLSDAEPERKAQLMRAWDAYAKDVGVVMPEPRVTIIDNPVKR